MAQAESGGHAEKDTMGIEDPQSYLYRRGWQPCLPKMSYEGDKLF
jgi:hypothetical protein